MTGLDEILEAAAERQRKQFVIPGALVVHDGTDAYDGSSAPPTRDLTARERDILCRVLGSIVYPFEPHVYRTRESETARAVLTRYVSLDLDVQVLDEIRHVINPRRNQ